jgi:hypothetical protein
MKISIARLKEIIMEEVARATLVETGSDCEEAEEDNTPARPLELEEEIEIVDDE